MCPLTMSFEVAADPAKRWFPCLFFWQLGAEECTIGENPSTSRIAHCKPGRYAIQSAPDHDYRSAMSDIDAVLAANLEFYRAFAMRDIAAMDLVWARTPPVACLHPGWTALTDREAVMASWRAILSNPDAPRIACFDERVLLFGETALVLCEEDLEGGTLAASNFFVREDGVWRIAHHQAGQIVRRAAESRRPSRLN
jgi:hypothetical protein